MFSKKYAYQLLCVFVSSLFASLLFEWYLTTDLDSQWIQISVVLGIYWLGRISRSIEDIIERYNDR